MSILTNDLLNSIDIEMEDKIEVTNGNTNIISNNGDIFVHSKNKDIHLISEDDTFIESKNGCLLFRSPNANIISTANSITQTANSIILNDIEIINEGKNIKINTLNDQIIDITSNIMYQGKHIDSILNSTQNQQNEIESIKLNQEIIIQEIQDLKKQIINLYKNLNTN